MSNLRLKLINAHDASRHVVNVNSNQFTSIQEFSDFLVNRYGPTIISDDNEKISNKKRNRNSSTILAKLSTEDGFDFCPSDRFQSSFRDGDILNISFSIADSDSISSKRRKMSTDASSIFMKTENLHSNTNTVLTLSPFSKPASVKGGVKNVSSPFSTLAASSVKNNSAKAETEMVESSSEEDSSSEEEESSEENEIVAEKVNNGAESTDKNAKKSDNLKSTENSKNNPIYISSSTPVKNYPKFAAIAKKEPASTTSEEESSSEDESSSEEKDLAKKKADTQNTTSQKATATNNILSLQQKANKANAVAEESSSEDESSSEESSEKKETVNQKKGTAVQNSNTTIDKSTEESDSSDSESSNEFNKIEPTPTLSKDRPFPEESDARWLPLSDVESRPNENEFLKFRSIQVKRNGKPFISDFRIGLVHGRVTEADEEGDDSNGYGLVQFKMMFSDKTFDLVDCNDVLQPHILQEGGKKIEENKGSEQKKCEASKVSEQKAAALAKIQNSENSAKKKEEEKKKPSLKLTLIPSKPSATTTNTNTSRKQSESPEADKEWADFLDDTNSGNETPNLTSAQAQKAAEKRLSGSKTEETESSEPMAGPPTAAAAGYKNLLNDSAEKTEKSSNTSKTFRFPENPEASHFEDLHFSNDYKLSENDDGDKIIDHKILGEILIFPADMDVEKTVQNQIKKLKTAVKKQLEYYFSDSNWHKEVFLKNNQKRDGWIDLEVPLKFNRVMTLLKGFGGVDNFSRDFISHALAGSTVVELGCERGYYYIRKRLVESNFPAAVAAFEKGRGKK